MKMNNKDVEECVINLCVGQLKIIFLADQNLNEELLSVAAHQFYDTLDWMRLNFDKPTLGAVSLEVCNQVVGVFPDIKTLRGIEQHVESLHEKYKVDLAQTKLRLIERIAPF